MIPAMAEAANNGDYDNQHGSTSSGGNNSRTLQFNLSTDVIDVTSHLAKAYLKGFQPIALFVDECITMEIMSVSMNSWYMYF